MFEIRPAEPGDIDVVCGILTEAAEWLESRGMPLWTSDEVGLDRVATWVGEGLFVLCFVSGEPAGTMMFQLSDPDFWPEVTEDDSAFVHRLAVRRRYAGKGVSTALMDWAKQRTRELGRRYLRLDCDAKRPKLREFYETYGFDYHSDFQWTSLTVSRYEMHLGGAGASNRIDAARRAPDEGSL